MNHWPNFLTKVLSLFRNQACLCKGVSRHFQKKWKWGRRAILLSRIKTQKMDGKLSPPPTVKWCVFPFGGDWKGVLHPYPLYDAPASAPCNSLRVSQWVQTSHIPLSGRSSRPLFSWCRKRIHLPFPPQVLVYFRRIKGRTKFWNRPRLRL